MDLEKYLIMIKDKKTGVFKDETTKIDYCNIEGRLYNIKFQTNDNIYLYNKQNVMYYENPRYIYAGNLKIKYNNKLYYNLEKCLVFGKYVRIFQNESSYTKTFLLSELIIEKNSLEQKQVKDYLIYIKKLAECISLKSGDESKILLNKFEKIQLVSDKSALTSFINKKNNKLPTNNLNYIYPFGVNLSPKSAIKKSFENQLSVIEGPPGTGKTQTILNIIANAVLNKKSVAVVSNNNSATKNIIDKLKKYNLEFIAAFLGNTENKEKFIETQNGKYPEIDKWKLNNKDKEKINEEIQILQTELDIMLDYKNKLVVLKQELSDFLLEKQYFDKMFKSIENNLTSFFIKINLIPKNLLNYGLNFRKEREMKALHFGLNLLMFLNMDFQA